MSFRLLLKGHFLHFPFFPLSSHSFLLMKEEGENASSQKWADNQRMSNERVKVWALTQIANNWQ